MSERPISQLMAYWAEQAPTKLAVTHDDQSITRAAFDARTNRLDRAYAEMGVKPNDFVTIGLQNSIAFFEAMFAVWKLGATPQPVSARLPTGERDAIIEIAHPSLLVGFAAHAGGAIPTVPVGFEPDATLSESALPERTARYFKAMTCDIGRADIMNAKAFHKFSQFPCKALGNQELLRNSVMANEKCRTFSGLSAHDPLLYTAKIRERISG